MVSLPCVLVVLAIFIAAPAAAAHDDLAPPGAPHAWLPQEPWILEHWMPFDRGRLERALGLRESQLEAYLFNDHHTLAELARRRGVDIDALADRLVSPWRPLVLAEQVAVFRERTMRVLTQGHLAQHMFFHVFHWFPIGATEAQRLFGVSEADIHSLRKHGLSPLEIAGRHFVAEADLLGGLAAVLHDRRRAAGLSGEAWQTESDRLLARQLQTLPCWIRSPRPTDDPGNPYGKATRMHGRHRAGWPATPAQRRRDERRAERLRRRLRHTCWPTFGAWNRVLPPRRQRTRAPALRPARTPIRLRCCGARSGSRLRGAARHPGRSARRPSPTLLAGGA